MLKFFASILVAILSAVLCAQTGNLIVILIAAAIGFTIAVAILSLSGTRVCPISPNASNPPLSSAAFAGAPSPRLKPDPGKRADSRRPNFQL